MVAQMHIDPNDLERISRVLCDPEFVGKPRREALSRIRRAGLREARRPLSRAGTGLAHRSMAARYHEAQGQVVIHSRMRHKRALSIERGERPGLAPPLRRLFRWRVATGDPRGAIEIQSHLRLRGAPGKRMFAGAVEYIRGRLPVYFRELADKLERRWARG